MTIRTMMAAVTIALLATASPGAAAAQSQAQTAAALKMFDAATRLAFAAGACRPHLPKARYDDTVMLIEALYRGGGGIGEEAEAFLREGLAQARRAHDTGAASGIRLNAQSCKQAVDEDTETLMERIRTFEALSMR